MGNAQSRHHPKYLRIPPYDLRRGPLCAPAQASVEDIPVICFDIGKKRRVKRYIKMMKARIRRARRLAQESYYARAITPMYNPSNPKVNYTKSEMERNPDLKGENPKSGHSYHIVELTNQREDSNRVQMLFRDYDQYLVGFRSFKDGRWSSWYRCSDADMKLPSFFNAIDMGVSGSHESDITYVGGERTLDDIFRTLWAFPYSEKIITADHLKRSFLSAIIVFSEALRLRVVYDIVVHRMVYNAEPSKLTDIAWKHIRNWGNLAEFVLKTAIKNKGWLDLEKFDTYISRHDIISFYELIKSKYAAVTLIMWKEEQMLNDVEELPRRLLGRTGCHSKPGGQDVLELVGMAFAPSPAKLKSMYSSAKAKRAARIARRAARRRDEE